MTTNNINKLSVFQELGDVANMFVSTFVPDFVVRQDLRNIGLVLGQAFSTAAKAVGVASAIGLDPATANSFRTKPLPQILGCNKGCRPNMHEWYVATQAPDGGYDIANISDEYAVVSGMGGMDVLTSHPVTHVADREAALHFLSEKERAAKTACEQRGIRFPRFLKPWNHFKYA